METFSALLVICARNSPVPGEFPAQRPVTRSFDVFFYLRLNKWLGKQLWGWWFGTPSLLLWRHYYEKWYQTLWYWIYFNKDIYIYMHLWLISQFWNDAGSLIPPDPLLLIWISERQVITYPIKSGMKLLIHFQTSTVAPRKFGNGLVISTHTLWWM